MPALKFSASPGAKLKGTLSAHIIPTLSFGISALEGAASATIFVDLDADATLELGGAAKLTPRSTELAPRAAVDFGGCVALSSGVRASAGAQGSLFGLLDAQKAVPLFEKRFSLFEVGAYLWRLPSSSINP